MLRSHILVLQRLGTRAALATQVFALRSVGSLKGRLQFKNLIRTSSFLHLFSSALGILFLAVLRPLGCLACRCLPTRSTFSLGSRSVSLEGVRLRSDVTGIAAVSALFRQFVKTSRLFYRGRRLVY